LSAFQQQDGLPFSDVLNEEQIQDAFEQEDALFAQEEEHVYTPAMTLWAFLSQVLYKAEQRSCATAVARVVVLLVALGRKPCSDNTGDYCRARAKLPEKVIERLAIGAAARLERQISKSWLWRGHHVKLVDGTTVTMADTEANQAVYPQQRQQKKGLGFPIARLVVLLSLATGMLSGMAMAPYEGKETGELALFRRLVELLESGDIALADRYFCSYFMIALLLLQGNHSVTRLHQRREANFKRGQRLGHQDHIVTWTRPEKPDWMDQATYELMPLTLQVRELMVHVHEPGFRTETLIVVTTLTDAKRYSRDDLAELYRKRWLAELDIRDIKVTLGMDHLRCKTPEMVRKEIWTCLLAYNLIRQTLAQSAHRHGLSPRQLSFTAAMQKVAASWSELSKADDESALRLIETNLEQMAGHRIGNRPNRVEPRAVKRRPKPHPLLTKPREKARAELMAGKI
jgi:hypothetical protein